MKSNIKASKGYDAAGYSETFRLMKTLIAQGYRIPNSLCSTPIQFRTNKVDKTL